jgi:Ca-activated chloride channel family protein
MTKILKYSLPVFLGLFFAQAGPIRADSFSSLNKKGNKSYERAQEYQQKGDKDQTASELEQALKYYRDAEIEKPESPELSYNLGNVMYQQEKYQDALDKYYKALGSDDVGHQAWSWYNLGNTFYRSGKYPEAIQAYEKCLDLTPDDEDAKYNLELVRKKMKEMMDKEQQRQQNQQQEQQQQQSQQQEQKTQQQQQEQRNQQNEQNQQEEQSQPQEQDQQQQEKEQQQQMKPKEGMTKEEAERILNALKDDEQQQLKKQKQAVPAQGRTRGKDW